jgi:hypothetical protein
MATIIRLGAASRSAPIEGMAGEQDRFGLFTDRHADSPFTVIRFFPAGRLM